MDDCAHYVCTTHFAFTPLDNSAHLRCYYTPTVSFVLYHCTFPRINVRTTHFAFTPLEILSIYDASVRRLAVLFYTTVRFYASTAHFAFTRLDDSTHLRCYCTPTGSFVLYHCTILRIYVSTAHFTS